MVERRNDYDRIQTRTKAETTVGGMVTKEQVTNAISSVQYGIRKFSQSTSTKQYDQTQYDQEKAKYLNSVMPSVEKIERFIGKRPDVDGYNPNEGIAYDSELGWVPKNAARHDGANGSRTFYHYETSGARQRLNFPNVASRVHTYGNSFTHCDQVNDDETWQEFLAALLREPIENFGVGGYSVYQAYLRMRSIERRHSAKYIILNIYDDDHFRNLDAWRAIRAPSTRGGTLPHVRVNIEKDQIVEVRNPCPTAQDVYKLRELDWVLNTFGQDVVLQRVLATTKGGNISPQTPLEAAVTFGLPHPVDGKNRDLEEELRRYHTQAALFSTKKILEMSLDYASQARKRFFVILSYGEGNLKDYLAGKKPFDQDLIDFLKARAIPFVDLRESHLADFRALNLDANTYAKRYYIGHYSAAGNSFVAGAIRKKVVEWLEPKPKTNAR